MTLLQGSVGVTATIINGTQTLNDTSLAGTSTAPQATNTQPCNGYPEFCDRRYSNITEVAAHNSPFVLQRNAGSNQDFDVITQLDDGIRMLQGQTLKVNGTLHYCHTSCDLLNAGTVESYLSTVVSWIEQNPYNVITILIGNGDNLDVTDYVAPIRNSGLEKWAYVPTHVPMSLKDWPTLGSMIISGFRAVIFMDYMANQTKVPYILDEFSQLWETPFSPTDEAFPCSVQRPPVLEGAAAMDRLYMANHNLNINFSILGTSALIPNTVQINQTNGVEGFGSLGLMANTCTTQWDRPPNFLLVDFYNEPSNGSVFEVAALHNNVTYHGSCCGLVKSLGRRLAPSLYLTLLLMFAIGSSV